MIIDIKKNLKFYLFLFLLIILVIFFYFFINKFQKETQINSEPISINLLTSVHPNLPWNFEPEKSKIIINPGDVTRISYIVENLGNKATTGIASLAYFPDQFGIYIKKINCFCYDAQTLKQGQKAKYTLILLIDPAVAKDSKTKNVKEVTIQFTFFDYKNFKKDEKV